MKNKAHISFILDKSGSMDAVKEATISGFNEYISTLKKDGNNYTFDFTTFDTQVQVRQRGVALKDVVKLSKENYIPGGNTALYDAVGETLMTRKSETGEKWIVVIMTDGEENSSRMYDEKSFAEMVQLLTNTGNVTFVFMGANQDSWKNAQKWNFSKGNVINFAHTDTGTRGVFMSAAVGTSAFAASNTSNSKNFFTKRADDTAINGLNTNDL